MNYRRYINKIMVRVIEYSSYEFRIYIGNSLYAIIDDIADAYREYNAINSDTVNYLA